MFDSLSLSASLRLDISGVRHDSMRWWGGWRGNSSGMREEGWRMCGGENDKEGKNEMVAVVVVVGVGMEGGGTGEIKGAETDSERGGFWLSEQQQAEEQRGKREEEGSRRRHGKSLSLARRLRSSSLMRRHQGNGWCGPWHAAVAGSVGVTSAPGPGGLKDGRAAWAVEDSQILHWTALWEPGSMRPEWWGGLPRGAAAAAAARVCVLKQDRKEGRTSHTGQPHTNTHTHNHLLLLCLLCLVLPFLCT